MQQESGVKHKAKQMEVNGNIGFCLIAMQIYAKHLMILEIMQIFLKIEYKEINYNHCEFFSKNRKISPLPKAT